MENLCDVPFHLQDHVYWRRGRRSSARQAQSARQHGAHRRCSCCRDDQELNSNPQLQHSSPSASRPQKRKRTSRSPTPSGQHEEEMDQVPSHQTSLSTLVPKLDATIPHAELPVVSTVAPSPQLSTAPPQDDGPVTICSHSVEEYQHIYHEVVDDMLRYKNGRLRPYSLNLGRLVKQKLWERVDRPTFTETVGEDGLVHVDMSYGVGVYPPLYNLDTFGEPQPKKPKPMELK